MSTFSAAVNSTTPEQCERGYELQVARDGDFQDLLGSYRLPNQIRISTTHPVPRRTLSPPGEVPPGRYWCRARSVGVLGRPGPWSEGRSFRVQDHRASEAESGQAADQAVEKAPPVRPITAARPLFVITKGHKAPQFWKSIPEKLKPYFCESRRLRHIRGELDHQVLVGYAHKADYPSYSTLEKIFKQHPRVIGFWYNESPFYPDTVGARNLRFAARHGRYTGNVGLGLSSAKYGAHEKFYGLLGRCGEYFLPVFKSQNPRCPLDGQINAIGLWLTGRVEAWGTDAEYWTPLWPGILAGYRPGEPAPPEVRHAMPYRWRKRQRPLDWMFPYMVGVAYGAKIYRVEGSIGGKKPGRPYPVIEKVWRTDKKQFGELWRRAMGAFFRDVVEQELVPTRREVMSGVKAAIRLRPGQATMENYPFELSGSVHGIPTRWYQWLPDNSRYGVVPVLPLQVTDREMEAFETILNSGRFASGYEAQEHLNRFYEPVDSTAFCVRSGDTGVITNSEEFYRSTPLPIRTMQGHFGKMPLYVNPEEYPVRARPQFFRMDLQKGPARYVEGEVAFHQYIILKQRPGELFLHLNNYREYSSSITLGADQRPEVRVLPEEALVSTETDGRGRVKVTVKHDHPSGAVRVFVR